MTTTWGYGDRFANKNSYMANNPSLKGRSKSYFNTSSLDYQKKTKRTINPSLSMNCIMDEKEYRKIQIKQKQHSLSLLNNKSTILISPSHYNPLINYQNNKQKRKSQSIINNQRNPFKDNLDDHMVPIHENIYRPHFKRGVYSKLNNNQINLFVNNNNYYENLKSSNKKKGNYGDYWDKKSNCNRNINNINGNKGYYATMAGNNNRKNNNNILEAKNYNKGNKRGGGNNTYYYDNAEINSKNYSKRKE